MLNSRYAPLCPVALPFQGRQKYAHLVDIAHPVMAEGYEDYLEPVRILLDAAGVSSGTAFMTVDEKVVEAGSTQRAPRPHVDGCFMPELMDWGHRPSAWSHTPSPGAWAHGVRRMPIIMAASVAGCRVFPGDFDVEPTERGDMTHATEILGEGIVVPANHGYLLSGDCVHESMVFDRRVERTFLRIALPVGSVSIS